MQQTKKTAVALAVAQVVWVTAGAHAQSEKGNEAGTVVVVTGQRAALNSAQKIKQDADEIVDSVVADDIGKLPDRSITEVLQRIVGVSIDRQPKGDSEKFSVEGTGVNIRGLNYVRSELNGREAFAANGGRSLSWGDVPPELMAGVDVYKNPSAEQTEGGISGLVNLRTALPFDFKGARAAASFEKSYSTLKKGKPGNSGSFLYSNRWKSDIGEWGVLFDLASSESATRTDTFQFEPFFPRTDLVPGRTVWVPKGAQWRSYEFERKRQGGYGALQWKRGGLRSDVTLFQSRYQDHSNGQSIFSSANAYGLRVQDGTYDDKGAFQTGTLVDPSGGISFNNAAGFDEGTSRTTEASWKLEWRASDAWTFKSDLQRVKARAEAFSSTVGLGMQMPRQQLDYRGELPSITFSDADKAFLANPANYYWGSTMEHRNKNTADGTIWKGDARYTFGESKVLRDVRFGLRFTDRSAVTQNSDPSYNWSAISQPWQLGWNINKLAYLNDPRFKAPYVTNSFPNFFNGSVNVPAVVFPAPSVPRDYPSSYAEVHSYHDILCEERRRLQGGGGCDPWKPAKFGGDNPAGTNDQSEKSQAAYGQLRFGFDDLRFPVDGNLGVRYVRTRSHSRGFVSFTPTANIPAGSQLQGVPIPNIAAFAQKLDVENSYDNVLPTLNLRMKASDKLQFRFAFGSSLSRPDFSSLQAYTTLNQAITSQTNAQTKVVTVTSVNRTGTASGNPMLKPITSKQADLTTEWYFANSGSLTLAVFDKRLSDVIVDQTIGYSLADTSGKMQDFLVTSPVNGAKGKIQGAELAYQQYYDGLPNLFKGFGFSANYTYVRSRRTLYQPVFQAYCTGGTGAANINLKVNGCDTDGRTFGNLPLPNLSKNSYNLALLYDRGPVSARIAYSWRSRSLITVSGNGTNGGDGTDTNPVSPTYGQHNVPWGLPLWAADYGQIDAGLSYKISENLKIDVQGQNLGDARYKQIMQQGIGDRYRAFFVSGPRYSLRLGYSFF